MAESVKKLRGFEPKAGGVGGGTCANFFRLAGMEAYAWSTIDEVMHSPNEYCKVENLLADAKVFAMVMATLCYPGQFT